MLSTTVFSMPKMGTQIGKQYCGIKMLVAFFSVLGSVSDFFHLDIRKSGGIGDLAQWQRTCLASTKP